MAEAKDETTKPEAAAPAAPTMVDINSPEFKAMLDTHAASVREALRGDMMSEVVEALTRQKIDGGNDMGALISELTVSIAQIADVGDNRKKISPAEAKRRVEAFQSMDEVMARVAKDKTLKPHYKVVSETYLDERLILPYTPRNGKMEATEIIWRGRPNTAMRPINPIADEIYGWYLQAIGGTTRNQAGLREHPTAFVGGLQIVSDKIPQTAVAHGLVQPAAAPMELGQDLGQPTLELTSTDDPEATIIPVLGTVAKPARRAGPSDMKHLDR